MGTSAQQGAVLDAVRQWQTRLLQLDRRNALLYFPVGKRGVKLRGIDLDFFLEALSSARLGLAFTYVERVRGARRELFEALDSESESEPAVRIQPGDIETDLPPLELQKRLTALRKRNREWQEEQGINVLFLALGFLHWTDEDHQPARSPILLAPCDLALASPRDPFRLERDESDDPIVNPTLRHKLAAFAGMELPELGEESTSEYLDIVRRLVAKRDGWRVEDSVVVAAFPYSKLAMWEDMQRMASGGVTHPLVRRLAGDGEAPIPAPDEGPAVIPHDSEKLRGARLDDLLDIREQFTVVDADFSQLRAIQLARSGANLVIHGPPGTGKSQTIANIIATLMADGRRVLFVSEKTAALDVVKRRLTDEGLGTFCLDLHSERGKKASVYAQLRQALELRPSAPTAFPFERLVARRTELNAVVRALHEQRLPLGLSVFEVHGRLAAIREAPRTAVPVRDIAALDGNRLRWIHDAAMRIARRGAEFRDHSTSRWRSLDVAAASPRLADLVREDMGRVRSATIHLRDAAKRAATTCGMPAPNSHASAAQLPPLLDHLSIALGGLPAHWLDPQAQERVQGVVTEVRRQIAARREVLEILRPVIGGALPGAYVREGLAIALAVQGSSASWERAAGGGWSRCLVAETGVSAAQFSGVATALAGLHEAAVALETRLGRCAECDTLPAVKAALDLAGRVLSTSPIPKPWDSPASIERTRASVLGMRSLAGDLAAVEDAISATFELELVQLVDEEMLVRFRTDHRALWRWFRSSYRRDLRVVRGCMRAPRGLSLDAATAAVERAIGAKRLQTRWSAAAADIEALLGDRFRGRATDWDRALSELDLVASIFRDGPTAVGRLHVLLIEPNARADLSAAVRATRESITTLDAAAAAVGTSAESAAADSLVRRAEDFAGFAAAGARVVKTLKTLGPFVRRPEDLDGVVAVLRAAVRFCDIEECAASKIDVQSRELGIWFRGWDSDVDGIDAALAWARRLTSLISSPLPPTLAVHACAPEDRAAYVEAARLMRAALDGFGSDTAAVAARFPAARTPWAGWGEAGHDAIEAWCDDLCAHADEASDWVEFCAASASLDEAVGSAAVMGVRGVTDDAALVPDVVLRHVYLSWLEHTYRAAAELRFVPRDLDSVRADFRDLDAKFPMAARERVREKCLAAYPINRPRQAGLGELGVLSYELAKRRKHLPVRKLVAKIPSLLQALKPCFMMSPLAVSQYLPRGNSDSDTLGFDTVIFDEASQVFPEDAVPAISRGAQVIVVGDQNQLPPSNFFRKDDGAEGDSDDEDEEPELENRLVGVESILDVLVGLKGAGVDDVYLEVHYRSRHDNLIRYSNHYFYGDRLLTFPSALATRPGLGLRSVYLPTGRFDAGASRTNRVEAEKVVELAFELMETRPPNESIGVVALSRAQTNLIEELINVRRLTDRRFDARFSEDAPERFFVKNLENVQGDERDHIILSIGYGPTTATGVAPPNRFGPINHDGGHRRLNVAVSRARRSMAVVHSLRPEDIRSETEGGRLLRRYLEFLLNGTASFESAVAANASGEAESPFEDAVGRALEARGYRIHRQVGCAKYAIDLAVRSEDDSGFDLGIECDGAMYHSSPSARDRDRLRQAVLERLGWRIHRVWSTAWIRNPKAELDAIGRAIADARSAGTLRETEYPQPVQNGWLSAPATTEAAPVPEVATFAFAPYVLADLRRFPCRADLRDERASTLAAIVVAVVEAEAPVHEDIVVERIRLHYGLRRAGRIVRDAIVRGIDSALAISQVVSLEAQDGQGRFLVLPGAAPVEARGPSVDGEGRSIDRISLAEIEAGVVEALRAMYGASRTDALIATARAFGFSRVGALVEARIGSCVDMLVKRGDLVERLGALAPRG